ncbi:MAG: sulfur carrier protein ThiS [Gammaproteobacteria bacterium]
MHYIECQVNGQSMRLPANSNVTDLLESMHIRSQRIAVERNRQVIMRSLWDQTYLQPDDRIEIVRAVGGG